MALKASRSSVGERLHRARLDRGLSLDQVAEATKIDRACLEALEHDLPPQDHHRGIYARIFLREYARYLGLKAKPLLEAYRTSHPEPDRPLLGGAAAIERHPSRWLARSLVGASVVALGLLTAINVRQEMGPSEGGEGSPAMTAPQPAASAPPPPSPSPTAEAPRGIRLVLRIADLPSWVQVLSDEEVLLEDTLAPGSVRRFRASRRLELVLGNAGAVQLEANGEVLEVPAGPGEVFAGTVVLRDDEVLLRSSE